MAPISDKRSPQPTTQTHMKESIVGGGGHAYHHAHAHGHGHGQQHHHHNHHHQNQPQQQHHHSHAHAKENSHNGNKQHSKKGLEILDFHESWLEEMEIYKDQMYVKKHQLAGHNHHHNHLQPTDSNNLSLIKSANSSSNSNNIIEIANTNEKRRLLEHSNNVAKSRIIVRNASAIAAAAAAASISSSVVAAASAFTSADSKQHGNVQLILKRPRESAKNGSHNSSKRQQQQNPSAANHTNQSQRTDKNNALPTPAPHNHERSGGGGSKSPTKIIVNQFHASTLLNSHQLEEKHKILTQNGLTKSAATAYETSVYASNYLPQDRVTGAKGEHRDVRDHDDPCAAIDDVNDYTDTDSDEEYIGCPFYLEDDGNQTQQSVNIRYQRERDSTDPATDDELDDDESDDDRTEYYKPKSILSPSLFPNVPPYLNFSSHAEKGPPMPSSLHKVLKWKLSPVMPKIVKRVVLNSGFRIIKNTTDWMAIWEKHMKSPGFRTIRSHQKYNHMPGSFRIGRKDSMWRSIYSNMKRFGSKEFGFMQKSYVMPEDLESLRQVWPKNASKLTKWIVKPPASARGTGIRIVNKWSQFPKDRPLVVQKYIEKPLLINDNKFDMRIYVVVTSINPLRIYMYKDGLARFASVKYSPELNRLDDRCMHLTNYSINKFSQNYSKNEDFNACQGHKWTLQSLWSCLESRGVNTKRLWATLRNLVIKAIISGESGLNRMYRQNVNFRYNCFELFGFDVLLDENLIPWLLEINISPSLHSELPLDLHVKGPLIQAVLNTALYQVPPKLGEKLQKDILDELMLDGPLCHDKRIFTTCLTAEEVRKHNQFTNRSIEFREEYLDSILEHVLPDDVRCLIISEDEFSRSRPLERIFPTPDTHIYLKFIDNPRYYNRLLDAWEHRYGHCREEGLTLLRKYCQDKYHLHVSDAALEKEPNVALTEIDMLHAKKSEDPLTNPAVDILPSDMIDIPKATITSMTSDKRRDDYDLLPTHCAKEVNSSKNQKHAIALKTN